MPEENKKEISKIEKLKAQKIALEAKIQLMENREKEQKRKKENRVKFLMGAFLLEKVTKEPETFKSVFDDFKTYLIRERDQMLVNEFFDSTKMMNEE